MLRYFLFVSFRLFSESWVAVYVEPKYNVKVIIFLSAFANLSD